MIFVAINNNNVSNFTFNCYNIYFFQIFILRFIQSACRNIFTSVYIYPKVCFTEELSVRISRNLTIEAEVNQIFCG